MARVWDLTTESVVFSRTHISEAGAEALYGVAFSPTDNLLAVSGADRTVTLWQPDNPQEFPAARLQMAIQTPSALSISVPMANACFRPIWRVRSSSGMCQTSPAFPN